MVTPGLCTKLWPVWLAIHSHLLFSTCRQDISDFARAWQAKRKPVKPYQWQAGSRCQVPILRLQNQVSGQISYGINSLGIGFDAMVNQQSKALRLGRLLAKWHLGQVVLSSGRICQFT